MRILITGCNGFIAKSIIEKLKHNNEINGVGRADGTQQREIMYVQADISNRANLFRHIEASIQKVDVIIHAAAEISDDVEKLYATNCCGTQNMVDLARRLECKRFVYISSVPVIGKPIHVPITENHKVSPLTVYHTTKYFGEQIVSQLMNDRILYFNLRIASPVGAGMPGNKIFSVFVENARKNQDITIWGDGKRIQNYIDVRDFADAVNKTINSSVQGLYNIPGNSISDFELANRCLHYYSAKCRINVLGNCSQKEPERWIISGEAAKRDLGYMPRRTIEDSICYVSEGLGG